MAAGHTGGTLDETESIPGFGSSSRGTFVDRSGTSVWPSSVRPPSSFLDKKLYGLRDVTATVENVSLIAASIMSKKIAAGANAIVLDVKGRRRRPHEVDEDATGQLRP